jgi:hypothetical protein
MCCPVARVPRAAGTGTVQARRQAAARRPATRYFILAI